MLISQQKTQIALNEEQNRLISEQGTLEAKQANIEDQLDTPLPPDNVDSAVTATALAFEASQIEATQQAIVAQQKQLEMTQTAVAQTQIPSFECSPDDYTPSFGGGNPPIGKSICIPAGTIGWISSDAAHINIPGIYDNTLGSGFTFVIFGPAKFTVTLVNAQNIRLDVRVSTDTSLVGNFDGKTINLVYQDGKVCEYSAYTGLACP
ncbi:MAG: hypothetical protein Fur0022_15610 [Anaerolineales bacterium]